MTAPLRMIQRHTPGVGEHRDVYLDRQTTQFESATIVVTLIVLVSATAAMIHAGWQAGETKGLVVAIALGVAGSAAWICALNDYHANRHDALEATWLLVRGRNAPARARRHRSKESNPSQPAQTARHEA